MNNNKWSAFYEYAGHESSVNTVAWAPAEFGLIFACGSSDGAISIVSLSGDGNWTARKIENAHSTGCTSVSWAPYFPVDSEAVSQQTAQQQHHYATTLGAKRIVSGGCDNQVKIWREDQSGTWVLDQTLSGHNDWVRDVAWSPSTLHTKTSIASCSQSGRVIIWTCDLNDTGSGALTMWKQIALPDFNTVAWNVSWSLTGNMLAVSSGDNKVSIWKEDHKGKFVCINDDKLAASGSS